MAASVADPSAARAAADQDWPAFVLVTGLLMVGFVADRDGLFSTAGEYLARTSDTRILFAGAAVLVVVVTSVLNLDTSVAFLTPLVVHTWRRRGADPAIALCGCILLSNAGSLLLPGSNLTNLIVLAHVHQSGLSFARRMAGPWVAACGVTGAVVAVSGRRELARPGFVDGSVRDRVRPAGLLAVVASAVLLVTVPNPALPVLAVGLASVGIRVAEKSIAPSGVWDAVGPVTIVGLFGLALTLGVVGREWNGPARLLEHLDPWSTAAAGAVASVAVNNLPAASLLSARAVRHPHSLLIGLNVGPNLSVTGSLAWLLWIRSSRIAGQTPPTVRAIRIGMVATPVAVSAAVGALVLLGGRT